MRVGLIALGLVVLPACGGGSGNTLPYGAGGSSGSGGGSNVDPMLRFSDAQQIVTEGDQVMVGLELNPPASVPVTGEFRISGTATFPDDHDLEPMSFVIDPGQTSFALNFSILDDLEVEEDEELIVEVINLEGADGPSDHQVVIVDDDVPSTTLTVEGPATPMQEAAAMLSFGLVLSEPAPVEVVITVDVAGTLLHGIEHDLNVDTVTIPAGETRLDIPFQVFDDVFDEGDDTLELSITSAPNANIGVPDGFVLTIQDDDPLPSVNVLDTKQVVSEADTDYLFVRLGVSAPSGRGIAVPYIVGGTASEGSDYTRDEQIHINPRQSINGDSSDFFLVDDDIPEIDETIVVTLQPPEFAELGSFVTHTIVIVDDDTPPATVASPAVSFETAFERVLEGTPAVPVPVLLSNHPSSTLTVPFTVAGSAAWPADHDLSSGSILFSSAERQKTLALNTVANDVVEGDRDVVITLQTPSAGSLGAPSALTVTIQDDDASPILFQQSEDESFGSSIAALGDVNGDMVPDFGAAHGWLGDAIVFSGADFSVLFSVPGREVFTAGDWDDDGLMDVAISDPNFRNAADELVGKVTVHGTAGVVLAELEGPQPDASFGRTLGGGCDLDGDGGPELIVAAPNFASGTTSRLGALFVYSSASEEIWRTLIGETEGDNLGTDIGDCAGDFNDDGTPDLIGGVRNSAGVESFPGATIYSATTSEIVFHHRARDVWAFNVAGLGDFDGNGTDDYAFSHTPKDCTGTKCQKLQIRSGPTLDLVFDVPITSTDTDTGTIPGSVAVADFDGDGENDLLVALRGHDGVAGADTGQLNVYSGATRRLMFVFQSPTAGRRISRVARIGDLNADGADEILVAALGATRDIGTIYVLSMNP